METRERRLHTGHVLHAPSVLVLISYLYACAGEVACHPGPCHLVICIAGVAGSPAATGHQGHGACRWPTPWMALKSLHGQPTRALARSHGMQNVTLLFDWPCSKYQARRQALLQVHLTRGSVPTQVANVDCMGPGKIEAECRGSQYKCTKRVVGLWGYLRCMPRPMLTDACIAFTGSCGLPRLPCVPYWAATARHVQSPNKAERIRMPM